MESPRTLAAVSGPASRPKEEKGRRYRALNLLSAEDGLLLKAVVRGEFAIAGFRNRDVREALFGKPGPDAAAEKKRSGQVTRRLQLRRAHGMIRKVPKSHRYRVTAAGMERARAVFYAGDMSLKTLSRTA